MPAPKIEKRDLSKLDVFAVVNGEQLTRQQIAQEAIRRFGEEMLQSLINRRLIEQALAAQKIVITEKDLDTEISEIAKKFGLSIDRWLEMLAKEREIPPEQYRYEIIWPTVALRRLAAGQLVVTDEELQRAWESEYGPRVQVREISTKDKATADRLYRMAVANPDDFQKLAKDYSEDPSSAAARGLIPPVRLHVGDPKVEEAVYTLREGEISKVIETAGQYLIFKCEKHLPATYVDPMYLETAKARLADRIKDRKLRMAGAELFKKLQNEARVVNVYNNADLRNRMPGVAATLNGHRITVHELAEECIRRHGADVLDGEIHRLLLTQQLQASRR